jgi:transcription elongation factor Elf1
MANRVLASDCPQCGTENVSYLASGFQTKGLKCNPKDKVTCGKCEHFYETDYLESREKSAAEIAASGVNVFRT